MIDLTPLDVRKKKGHFRRVLRGYDPDEVDTFLGLVSDRFNDVVRENLSLSERTKSLEKQIGAMESREWAVQDALVTAQELRKEMDLQSRREAEALREQVSREVALTKAEAEVEIARRLSEADALIRERQKAFEELERSRLKFLKSFRFLLQRELDGVDVEEARDPLGDTPLELQFRTRMLSFEREVEPKTGSSESVEIEAVEPEAAGTWAGEELSGESGDLRAAATDAWETAEGGLQEADKEHEEVWLEEGPEAETGEEEVLLMPGREDVAPATGARRSGAFDYMVQPVEAEALQDLVKRVLKDGQPDPGSSEASRREGDRDEEVPGGFERQTLAGAAPGEWEDEETPKPHREPEWMKSLLNKEEDLNGGHD